MKKSYHSEVESDGAVWTVEGAVDERVVTAQSDWGAGPVV